MSRDPMVRQLDNWRREAQEAQAHIGRLRADAADSKRLADERRHEITELQQRIVELEVQLERTAAPPVKPAPLVGPYGGVTFGKKV